MRAGLWGGGEYKVVGTSLQTDSSRPNTFDLTKGTVAATCFGAASADLFFTQQCPARPPSSTSLSFRGVIKSSADEQT